LRVINKTLLTLVAIWNLKTVIELGRQVWRGENGFTKILLLQFATHTVYYAVRLFGLRRLVNPALALILTANGLMDIYRWRHPYNG